MHLVESLRHVPQKACGAQRAEEGVDLPSRTGFIRLFRHVLQHVRLHEPLMHPERDEQRLEVVGQRLLDERQGGVQVRLGGLSAQVELGQVRLNRVGQGGGGAGLELGQDRPHRQRVAVEQVHQPGQVGVVAVDLDAQLIQDAVTVRPPLLALQSGQGDLATLHAKPRLLAATREDDLARAAAEPGQERPQPLAVGVVERGLDRRAGDPADDLEVVPDDDEPVLGERNHEGVELGVVRGGGEVGAEERLAHPVEDELGRADVLEREPEAALTQAGRAVEPLDQAAGERRLAHAGQALDENAGRVAMQRPLQLEQRAVPPDEAVRVGRIARLLGQHLSGGGLDRGSLRREREVQRFLLVQDGDDPVVQRELAASTDPTGMGQHLLPPGPDGLGDTARPEQPTVERRQESLRGADVDRVRHRHDAPHARSQQRRGHRCERVLGPLVEHGRLAGVQDDGGHGVLAEQDAELIGEDRGFLAVLIFED